MKEEQKAFLSATGIPVGTILAFAGEPNRVPRGWMICDGQVVSNAHYPQLFASIGTVWGGSGTPDFYVPDLRGMFLRGVAGEVNIDPDKDTRTSPQAAAAPANPCNKGNSVGSVQKDELLSHIHDATATVTRNNILGTNGGHDADGGDEKWNGDPNYGSIGVTVMVKEYGGNETRPVNAYVHYIIKVDDQQ